MSRCYVKMSLLQCKSSKSKKTDTVRCGHGSNHEDEDISFNQVKWWYTNAAI